MPYLNEAHLKAIGFKKLGKDVRISDRASIYNADRIEIGDHVRIDDFCVLSGTISLGRFVYIAPLCVLAGGEKGIKMDDFSTLSYSVQIFTQTDDYSGMFMTNPTVPYEYKDEAKAAVSLGRHVIIGTRAAVLPGVVLAEGCSVGAMSLVTKSTEPWGIYFGTPARRQKERKKDLLELEKKFLERYDRDSL